MCQDVYEDGFYELPMRLDTSEYKDNIYISIHDDRAYYFGINEYGEDVLRWTYSNNSIIYGCWPFTSQLLINHYDESLRLKIKQMLQKQPLKYICAHSKDEFKKHFADFINELHIHLL